VSEAEIERIYETVVYGRNLDVMAEFYADVLGLRLIDGPDELAAAFRVPNGGMLLVFDPSRSSAPGRAVPSHGATGAGHVAFAVPPGTLELWRKRLGEHEIEIECEVAWDRGGRSLYVRDPAGNSVELTEDELWPA
jgi:catechol 2,3-dioxygenase-like lactoylglutathione lyase family enzyme